MKKKRFKLLALMLLALFFMGGIVGAGYSYWAGSVSNPTADVKSATITVGEGKGVTTEVDTSAFSSTDPLVPSGQAANSTGSAVEYVIADFDVEWKEVTTSLAANHPGTLSAAVKAGTTKIDGSDTYANLVVTAVQVGGTAPSGGVLDTSAPAILLDGSAVTVYVKVTLTEPANKTVYDAVAKKDITFDVEFSVVAD